MFSLLLLLIIIGFLLNRMFIISLILGVESIFLIISIMMITNNIFNFSISSLSMSLITMAVLEAAIGLCFLLLMMRFFFSSEMKILSFM